MKPLTIKNQNNGFTLIEILIAVAIFTAIAGAATLFARNIWVYGSFISTGINDTFSARSALKTMTAEIRTASSANTGAYIINEATASSFTFYSDIDDNGLKERIRYFISGTDLMKGVTRPTGNPAGYTEAEIITTLLSNVTSTNIFEYYDKNYDGTSASLASPVDVALVRLVKITFTIDKDPNRAPDPTTFSTSVSIRNLKDNL
ncbi:MAG: prepilin-type N-terminal cleavage/methylation domain-containing protein [Candidatus Pacebacteria bacterium]|nr:prepilin-type N-terminal cleavage/methylation domain-containing protein [Candidatus Paceibacterota bacterium]